MLPKIVRSVAAFVALAGCLAAWAPDAAAQTATQAPVAPRTMRAIASPPAMQVAAEDPNAERTREQFMELLNRYPPSVGRVLKLDPTLLSNPDYMTTYPSLAAFLAQHPEVARNPTYFLDRVRIGNEYVEQRQSDSYYVWRELMSWMGGLSVAAIIALTLSWLIRTLVDFRRWSRLTKVQTEAHNKLLDRMTANEDLLAYVQSNAGAKFLESAPITLEPGNRRIGAPFTRILWSVQAGLVLIAAGIGMNYVASKIVNEFNDSRGFYALGVLGIALGVGFLVSGAASYVLSQRLGLFNREEGK